MALRNLQEFELTCLKIVAERDSLLEGDPAEDATTRKRSRGKALSHITLAEVEAALDEQEITLPAIASLTVLHQRGFLQHPTGDSGTPKEEEHTLTAEGARELKKYEDGLKKPLRDPQVKDLEQVSRLAKREDGSNADPRLTGEKDGKVKVPDEKAKPKAKSQAKPKAPASSKPKTQPVPAGDKGEVAGGEG
jgi:hypothetical protein